MTVVLMMMVGIIIISDMSLNTNMIDKSIVASPQIVFKMAKKIAQLTKVVTFLHSRTEDHDDELDYLTEKIQEHVEEIRNDNKLKMRDLSLKDDESRILLKAHEGMISSNLERIHELESEMDILTLANNDLKNQLKDSQK